MNENIIKVLFSVEGKVQGVGYRYFVYRKAKELNIRGYVRNLFDGSVEALAEGKENNIEIFYEHLKTGPFRSNVQKVSREIIDSPMEFDDFSIR